MIPFSGPLALRAIRWPAHMQRSRESSRSSPTSLRTYVLTFKQPTRNYTHYTHHQFHPTRRLPTTNFPNFPTSLASRLPRFLLANFLSIFSIPPSARPSRPPRRNPFPNSPRPFRLLAATMFQPPGPSNAVLRTRPLTRPLRLRAILAVRVHKWLAGLFGASEASWKERAASRASRALREW